MDDQGLARLFKTLGDPTRLRLLRLLRRAELSVMELAEVTELAQSRVSNHLKVLREEGLLQERRDGAFRHYRVDADRLPARAAQVWPALAVDDADPSEADADRARLAAVLARREARQGGFFDRVADQWDAIRTELFGDSIARALLRVFIPADLAVADIGAGTGYALELFGDRPRRLIAIDRSEAMLAVARRKVEALGMDKVDFRLGDAMDPPLARGEADLAILAMVLHYLEDPKGAVMAAAGRLEPGGMLFIADFLAHQQSWLRTTLSHRWLGFERAEVRGWLAEAGLREETWTALPGRARRLPGGEQVQAPDGFALLARRLSA